MKTTFLLLCFAIGTSPVLGWESPVAKSPGETTFPLSLAIIDPDANEKLPPYIVVFEGGLDKNGTNVRGPLSRLEALRGASKMFPESNQNLGLPVVLRGLRFHCLRSADGAVTGYEVELQGEFNMVRVPISASDVNGFLAGQRTTFVLTGEKNYGILAYKSVIKMEVQLTGKELHVFNIEGDFTFREALATYTSPTKRLSPPPGRTYLYRGEVAELPVLPSI